MFIKDFLSELGSAALFMGRIIGVILRGRVRWGLVFKEIYAQGVQSVLIVLLAAFASGAVLAMQGQVMMSRFGAKEFIAQLVALSLVRELGPVFTALVFSGKSGAGMASELATMTVNSQVQATRMLGIDPVEFLVVPRFVACVLVLPILVVMAELIGIMGGYLVGVVDGGVPGAFYMTQTVNAIGFTDFFSGVVKAGCFSGLIGWICCYRGFSAAGGSLGVGQATTRAVAACYISVIVSNTMLTKLIMTFWGT